MLGVVKATPPLRYQSTAALENVVHIYLHIKRGEFKFQFHLNVTFLIFAACLPIVSEVKSRDEINKASSL